MYRFARNAVADDLSIFKSVQQLVDPSLRSKGELFPNLRIGQFGDEALAEDLTPYHISQMFRAKPLNLNTPKTYDNLEEQLRANQRHEKAKADLGYNAVGFRPIQSQAITRQAVVDPSILNNFDLGIGTSFNSTQREAIKNEAEFEFNRKAYSDGFDRSNKDIVPMQDLQESLLTSNTPLTNAQGTSLINPALTKGAYSFTQGLDMNDPQHFYNLKAGKDVDYNQLAGVLNRIAEVGDGSLHGNETATHWDRVQGYKPFAPKGTTYVTNSDKPTQTVDEIVNDVNQIEVLRPPRMADSRIQRNQNSGNSDNNNIPKDFTRKEYLEATGDSDNLPPLDYSPNNTLVELFGGIAADRNGNTFPMTKLRRKESSILGREFNESNASSAFTFPRETRRAYKLLRDGNPTIEDRTFLLNQPSVQRPTTRLGKEQLGTDYYNPYRESYGKGTTNLSDDLYLRNFSQDPNNVFSANLAWDESNPSIANYPRRIGEYNRIPGQTYNVGRRDNLPMYETKDGEARYFKDFTSPEIVLPDYLSSRFTPEIQGLSSKVSPKESPNNYRIAGSKAERGGYNEFNEVMDEGIQASQSLDRLYKESDEFAGLAGLPFFKPQGEAIAYQQSDVLDRIVEAERTSQNMGGTYRRLSGAGEQGVMEGLGIYNEPAPSAINRYNVDEVLEPSFRRDYSGTTNTERIRVPSGINYDAGIPVPTSRTRIANESFTAPKQRYAKVTTTNPETGDSYDEWRMKGTLQTPTKMPPFNQAQYTRDMIDRGGTLIDTQLGIPIVKASTSYYDPKLGKNVTYAQSVRPSQVKSVLPWYSATGESANWQAPESMVTNRVGKQIAINNIPLLPISDYAQVETSLDRRGALPMATLENRLAEDRILLPTPMARASLSSRERTDFEGQVLYPNAGIGPVNRPFNPVAFGFTGNY